MGNFLRPLLAICLSCLLSSLTIGCSTPVVPPTGDAFDGEAGGCGDFHVYCYNNDRTLAIFITIDARGVPIDGSKMRIDLAEGSEHRRARAGVYQWERPTGAYFCNDVADDRDPIARWEARTGTVTAVRTVGTPPSHLANATHQLTVVFMDLVLWNPQTGEQATIDHLEIPPVWVGWLAG